MVLRKNHLYQTAHNGQWWRVSNATPTEVQLHHLRTNAGKKYPRAEFDTLLQNEYLLPCTTTNNYINAFIKEK